MALTDEQGGVLKRMMFGLLIALAIVIHQTALDLASRLDHPLSDTLYHAVALHTPGALLVTADRRYFTKAEPIGQILLLNNPLPTAREHRDA